MQKIQQWLNIYDGSGDADPTLAEMIELAQHERQQLQQRPPMQPIDPRAQELLDDIARIIEQDDDATVRTRLRGIIETFGEAPWAARALEQAGEHLRQTRPEQG